MDFRQTSQPSGGRATVVAPTPSAPEHKEEKPADKSSASPKHKLSPSKLMRGVYLVLLVGIAVLLACIALGVGRGNTDNESKYVDGSKYQAVFLNNGQVYFGNIKDLNRQYVRMSNIYYLTQSSDSANSSNYSLVKLGCQQIHDPLDQMVINRDQVTFWENLNDDGKVVTSIKEFQKQNPNGPDCTQVSNQTQASPNSATSSQNSTSGSGTATGTGSSTSTTGSSTTGSNSTTTK